MDRSVFPTNWKPEETNGNCTQLAMPLIGEVPTPQVLGQQIVKATTFNGCLAAAVLHCGMDEQEIAKRIHISKGYMSKFLSGVAQVWAKRLLAFMRVTGSLAPLQWLADQMGCELLIKNEVARERDELRARLAELDRRERMVA
jgi:transcriptional regulator with XRE-family HTH domain